MPLQAHARKRKRPENITGGEGECFRAYVVDRESGGA
jgi:hypothetical protein